MITASDRKFGIRLDDFLVFLSFIYIPMILLGIAAFFTRPDIPYEALKVNFALFLCLLFPAYIFYTTREGEIYWNEERILLRTKARWKLNPPIVETELRYEDLDRVQAEASLPPNGDTRPINRYRYAALYAKGDSQTPAIKIGFQYHRKADILEFLTYIQSHWPEKCSDDIVEAINTGSFGN